MKVNLEIHTQINGSRGLRGGAFSVIPSDFKKDPDWTAVIAAYEWIREIKRQHPYDVVIEKIIYNGENDITELVSKVRPKIDELPF